MTRKNLWAPWRIKYILEKKTGGCIFCQKVKEQKDKENHILYRGKTAFIIMNLYPYNSGHLMILPYRHTSDFLKLTEEENREMCSLLRKSTALLSKTIEPHGFNIGLNIGRVAGAGIDDHIHWHVVPRWKADTNFMPVIADTNIVPQALDNTYKLLKEALNE